MRAVVVSRLGGPEVLQVAERDVPAPGPGEILVDVGDLGRSASSGGGSTGLMATPPGGILSAQGSAPAQRPVAVPSGLADAVHRTDPCG